MGKRCVFATIATIVAVAIALGVGLGLGLKSDDAAAGVFVYGETELTGFSSSEFNGNPNNALNFRRGVASTPRPRRGSSVEGLTPTSWPLWRRRRRGRDVDRP